MITYNPSTSDSYPSSLFPTPVSWPSLLLSKLSFSTFLLFSYLFSSLLSLSLPVFSLPFFLFTFLYIFIYFSIFFSFLVFFSIISANVYTLNYWTRTTTVPSSLPVANTRLSSQMDKDRMQSAWEEILKSCSPDTASHT